MNTTMQSSSVRRVLTSAILGRLLAIALTSLGVALLPLPAHAQFLPTGAGPFDYNATSNWTGATINGVFSQTPSAAQVVTFDGNSTLTSGFTFSLGSTSPSLTLRGDGTARTVTLGGDVSVSGTTSAIVLGSTTAGNGLNLVLGADRTFSVASGNTLYVNNVVSGANALTKAGTGQLTLAGANTYTGTTTVTAGTLFLNASGALAAGNNVALNSTAASTVAQLTLGTGVNQAIGTLTLGGAGATTTSNNYVTLNSGSTLTLGGTVTFDATNNVTHTNFSGSGTLALGANRIFDIGNSATTSSEVNVYTPISGAGLSLTKTGAGRLALNSSGSTYDGGTIINGGEIFLNASNTLVSTGALTINDTAGATARVTLVGNATQTIGALTFGGAGATANSANTLTISAGSTLTLGGTVTYDATGNPLRARIDGPGTLALGGDRIFNVGQSTADPDLSIFAPISGTGYTLTKTGGGRMDVYGPNSYTGGTIVQGGTLFLNVASPLLAASPVSINAVGGGGANLSLGVINETVGSLTFGGAGSTAASTTSIFINTGGTLTLGGTVTYDATGNPLASTISGGMVALGGNRTINVGNSTTTTNELTISSPMTGSGQGLTKTGAGVLTLSGANTYSGGTVVNGGTLALSGSGRLASGSDVTINSTTAGAAAVLTLSGNATQTIGALTLGGAGATTTSNNHVTLNAGSTLTLGGTVTFDATNDVTHTDIGGTGTLALGGNRTFAIGNSATTFSEVNVYTPITGAEGDSLTKTGAGRLALNGPDPTYGGGTVLSGGELFLNASNTLPAGGAVTVNQPGSGTSTLVVGTNRTQTIGALTLGGNGSTSGSVNNVGLFTGGTLTLGGTVTYDATGNPAASTISGGTVALGGNRTFDVGNSTTTTNELTISSPMTGSGQSLTKTGGGVLRLSGANTYDGGTILNAGGILLNASNTLAATGAVTVNDTAGATATVTLVGNATQTIGALTFGGAGATATSVNTLTISAGSTLTLGGTLTYDATGNPLGTDIAGPGTLALGANRTIHVGDSSNTTGELDIFAPISGSGFSLTKAGAGRLALVGANTYSGGTVINNGNIFVNASNSLPTTGAVVINNTAGTTSNLSFGTTQTHAIGALTLGGAGSTTTSANTVTIGTGSTLTLGGTVTYDATGNPAASTISGGTLALGGNRVFDVGDSSTATSSDLLISSVVTGSGQSLTKTGEGRLGFQGANTYDGGTIINGGTVFLNNSNNLSANGNVTVNNTVGGTSALTLLGNITQTIGALTFGGAGGTAASVNNVTIGTGGTLTLGGTVTFNATGNPTASTVSTISGGTLALGGNRTFAVADSTGSSNELAISSVISGAGQSITKTGAGRLYFLGANTYDGGTVLNGGQIFLGANNTLVSTGAVTVNNTEGATSTFILGSNVAQTIGSLTFGGAGATSTSTNNVALNTGATLTLGGTVTYDATGNPAASTISGGTLALGGSRIFNVGDSTTATSSDLLISSAVTGSGQSLVKTGSGRLGLQAVSNTYDGGTIINGGTVFLGANNTLATNGAVTVNNTEGGTSRFVLSTNVVQTIGALTFGGAGGTAASVNNVTIGTGGTLTLGGTVTFNATGNPTASTVSTISGGTLALGGNRTFAVANSTGSSNELAISSAISGAGQSITKTGAGRLYFLGANTYDGGTVLNGGQIFLGANNTLAATGAVTVNNTEGSTSTFILSTGVAQTIGTLAFGGAGGSTTSTNQVTLNTGATLTLGGTVSYHATGSLSQAQINGNGTLALGGNRIFDIAEQASLPTELFISSGVSLGGTGYSLTKTGAGALGLEGASTYTGGTIVAAGVLAIWNPTGSATGTGPVTVQSGARIRGIGSVGGPTTLEAGAIAGTGGTGGTAGTLTFANGLTLNDGAVFNFQLGTTSDRLRLTGGNLTGASTPGSLAINLTAGTGFGAGVYTLFDFSTGGVTTSSFDVGDFALVTTVSGYTYGLAMAGNTLQLTATASAIPEPSTYAAIFGAVSLLGAAVWRRRVRA